MLWNISGLFSLWLHAYKQHSICALSALANNSIQQEWFSRLKQLVLRFLPLYSVGYIVFFTGLGFGLVPEPTVHSTYVV